MRKILAVVILLLLLIPYAQADATVYFQTDATIFVGIQGRDASILFDRIRTAPDGTLQVVDEQGNVLGQRKVYSGEQYGTVTIHVPQDAPAMQTMRLLFLHGASSQLQCEFLFSADTGIDNAVTQGPADQKKIAITFDAAYGEGRLDALLDVLDKYGAKCTFFLQGDFVTGHPNLTAEIFARGHELGNHTMHHPDDMREIGNQQIYLEINACNEAIEAVTGTPVTLYRPPSGYYSYRDRAISRGLGCEVILWTFDSLDGFLSTSTKETVWNAMVNQTQPGAIILMHIYGYWTPEILDQYLPMMQNQGYAFVTVSDLLGLNAE